MNQVGLELSPQKYVCPLSETDNRSFIGPKVKKCLLSLLSKADQDYCRSGSSPSTIIQSNPLVRKIEIETEEVLAGCNKTLREIKNSELADLKPQWRAISLIQQKVLFDRTTKQSVISQLNGQFHSCKNRYPFQVLPFDYNLVMTQEGKYVNASRLENSGLTHVVTQGPLEETIPDHFALAKENGKLILCLTQDEEDGRQKCANYWDGRRHRLADGSTIQLDKEKEVYPGITERMFLVEGTEETITQIHVTGWPDMTAPDMNTIHFLLTRINPAHPSLVHCSAGIGRTGTWIAIQILRHQIHEQIKQGTALNDVRLNIPKLIIQLRLQRVLMVIRKEQFFAIVDFVKNYYLRELSSSTLQLAEKSAFD